MIGYVLIVFVIVMFILHIGNTRHLYAKLMEYNKMTCLYEGVMLIFTVLILALITMALTETVLFVCFGAAVYAAMVYHKKRLIKKVRDE